MKAMKLLIIVFILSTIQLFAIDGFPGTTLEFDGLNDYVDLGEPADLKLTNFTLSCWFKRTGTGTTAFTGTGGIYAEPLITKGRAESDGSNADMNYFLGIRPTDNLLVADFEDMATGLNHPVIGVTPINNNEWYHATVSYDSTTWRLYLNGNLEIEQVENATPRYDSIQDNAIGSALTSIGIPSGYFKGYIEEASIWSSARTTEEIRESMYLPLSSSETGLVSYWQFNDSTGTVLSDVAGGNTGTLTSMEEADWINSTIPFGGGYSNTQIVNTTGVVDFTDTDITMDITAKTGTDSIIVAKINLAPNMLPTGVDGVFDNQYWVVDSFGSGTVTTDISFTVGENIDIGYETDPEYIKLYGRDGNADGNWTFISDAVSVNTTSNSATFTDITNFGQYIVVQNMTPPPPSILLFNDPNSFSFVTDNFNSIDAGTASIPTFTDLDGDDLLDMLIGELAGNINHYEQDSINSTSFSLITESFNSIDVGGYSAPAFTDLDGDGLLDLLIGESDGNINYYEQDSENSTSFSLITESFNSIDVGNASLPSITDLDGDGLIDLLFGAYDDHISHYEQDSENSTSFTLVTTSFNSIYVSGSSVLPSFVDLNGDGLLDLLFGESDHINHYEQDSKNSTSFTLVTTSFDSITVEGFSLSSSFTDLDGDGLIDMLIGENAGNINHYEQASCDSLNFGVVGTGDIVTKNYFTKASNLIDDLNVTSPEGYSISLSENTGYAQSLSIVPVNGSIADTIFVRFEPITIAAYNDTISHILTDMDDIFITITGIGIIGIPQNIVTEIFGTSFKISWDSVPGAIGYKVFSSDDPYGTFADVTAVGYFDYPTIWIINPIVSKKFYYVVAVSGGKVPLVKKDVKTLIHRVSK